MVNALARQEQPLEQQIEQVVISGDLKNLQPAQRVDYYNRVCQSVGLNPYTRPFEYITLNGKLTLYARRDAADQLRSIHGISLSKPHIEYPDDMVVVTVEAVDREGRTDTDLGAVSIKNLQGEARANAIMKAITKAKRRVTLSLAGLGWLDETEVDSIPGAQRVMVSETGEIVEGTVATNPFNDTLPFYERDWRQLTGPRYDLVRDMAELHDQSDGPCSAKQYQYLTGIIDALTNEHHNYTLSILCQSEISGTNMPGRKVAGTLLKFLPETVVQKDSDGKPVKDADGKSVMIPNPDYNRQMAEMIADFALAEAGPAPFSSDDHIS